jgi:hypothetical protein
MEVSGPPAIQAALPPSPPASERGLSTHRIGGCVGLTAALDVLEKREISCFCWDLNHGLSSL